MSTLLNMILTTFAILVFKMLALHDLPYWLVALPIGGFYIIQLLNVGLSFYAISRAKLGLGVLKAEDVKQLEDDSK